MSDSISAQESALPLSWSRAGKRDTHEQYAALIAELQATRLHVNALLREKADLLQRQEMRAQEFEHRLVNSVQFIVSLLSLQSRAAPPDAAVQLTTAANRVASFGRVHR